MSQVGCGYVVGADIIRPSAPHLSPRTSRLHCRGDHWSSVGVKNSTALRTSLSPRPTISLPPRGYICRARRGYPKGTSDGRLNVPPKSYPPINRAIVGTGVPDGPQHAINPADRKSVV